MIPGSVPQPAGAPEAPAAADGGRGALSAADGHRGARQRSGVRRTHRRIPFLPTSMADLAEILASSVRSALGSRMPPRRSRRGATRAPVAPLIAEQSDCHPSRAARGAAKADAAHDAIQRQGRRIGDFQASVEAGAAGADAMVQQIACARGRGGEPPRRPGLVDRF